METICLITGSSGLIGSESVSFFKDKFDKIIGIDNDMRAYFFGDEASTKWNAKRLENSIETFKQYEADIRKVEELEAIFKKYGDSIQLIIHTAAQPSHDWAAKEPFTDFTVNANGTLNMLEMTRQYCPKATFIFTSTNKVYGDTPNHLPLIEKEKRWEIDENHPYYKEGIDEQMSIDQTKHSLFGASKVAADVLVQEYGKYFEMNTGTFRGGCLTGPNHSGTQLHGFLSYLMKCAITGDKYTIFGYQGKQVRDNIHSWDLVNMFWHFHKNPKQGEVYNAGGGRYSNCSMAEAIEMCEEITGKKMNYEYSETNRIGDHIWWISDVSKFKKHYPDWNHTYNVKDILNQIFAAFSEREKS
ncbi:NAD-dependent epimerase/dehydratase family protein [Marixanthomonas sp. SCSIO 43207]|uniref:NAD-dependent epimerase/dehydratase family protein n=1 Tax=Marixanthomonas sp. SCSIO 43207 TaxID=2779360 RepID=UPI001CA997A0|nr:NAD-dependent epimerase/dehydratase family protein [Marixanthomonas sp. SCSIO 43207]UAB81915.1 NAD-dependent epimerase/dehydratase family protein [Marixanthomonas sp. SCSIO 43207]